MARKIRRTTRRKANRRVSARSSSSRRIKTSRRRKPKKKNILDRLLTLLKDNGKEIGIGSGSIIGARALYGFLNTDIGADGIPIEKPDKSPLTAILAALAPTGIALLLGAKDKAIFATLVGGAGGVLSDISTPEVASRISSIAPDSPEVMRLASGILQPVSLEPSLSDYYYNPAVNMGDFPDADIGELPDADIGELPDADIGQLPDSDLYAGLGDYYELDS